MRGIGLFPRGMEGKKLDLIAKDNRAAFEMDCDHRFILYEALKILMRQYHAEDFQFNTDMMKVTAVLKMTVTEMTGKRRDNTH